MKIFIYICMIILLTSCNTKNDIDETIESLDKSLHKLLVFNGCLGGFVEFRKQYIIKNKKDIPLDMRKYMIGYCGSLSEKENK